MRVAVPALCTQLLLCIGVVACVRTPSVQRAQRSCPVWLPPTARHVDALAPRIVGGAFSGEFIRSHLVSFYDEGCAGTLLSSRWALTAAHCLVTPSSNAFVSGHSSNSGTPVAIEAVFSHPQFFLPKHDVALVKFAEDVPQGSRFVRINDNDHVPATNEVCRVAGYGYTDEGFDPAHDARLRQVDVPVVDTTSCKEGYQKVDSFLSSGISQHMHICAGYEQGGCDSCNADSGGPLVVYDQQLKLVQIALVSFGYGCARAQLPGGYTRLSSYIDWIKSVGAEFETASSRSAVMMDADPGATNGDDGSTQPPPPPLPPPPPPAAATPASAPPIQSVPLTRPPPVTQQPAEQPVPSAPPVEQTSGIKPVQAPSSGSTTTAAVAPPTVQASATASSGAQQPTVSAAAPVVGPTDLDDDDLDDDDELLPSAEAQKVGVPPSDGLFVEVDEEDGASVGAIAGGTVGAVALVAAVVAVVLLARRKQNAGGAVPTAV